MPDSIIWNRAASSLFPKKEQVTHSESKQPDKKIERDPRREREPLTNRIMLYRYFALREEQHFQWLSDLLESGKIFFPRATRFNDPNEFRFQLRVPKDKEVIRAGWHQDNPHGSKEEFEAWFSSTSFTSWHIYLEPLMHREFLSAFGVVCFSERADSPTMWSHYANNHGGICVGFNGLSVNSFSGIKLSGKVNYQNELPIVQYFGEEKKRVVHKIFFTKNSDWNYEREFRLVAEADAALTMDPALIREVILGMNIDGLTEERVRQMVAKRHTAFPVRTAHLSYATYEMEIS